MTYDPSLLSAQLMDSLKAAIARLRGAGLSDREIVAVVNARLNGPMDPEAAEQALDSLGRHDLGAGANSGPGFPVDGRVYGPPPGRPAPFPPNQDAPPEVGVDTSSDRLGREQDPSGLPVGTVVTDTRTRACWLEPGGWRRAGTDALLTWAQVVEAVGGPEGTPQPGQPTIVSRPQERAQGPMRLRPGGKLDVVVDHVLLDAEGKPMTDPDGRPRLTHQRESIEISEIVPDA